MKAVTVSACNRIDIQEIGGGHTILRRVNKGDTHSLLNWAKGNSEQNSFIIQSENGEITCITRQLVGKITIDEEVKKNRGLKAKVIKDNATE